MGSEGAVLVQSRQKTVCSDSGPSRLVQCVCNRFERCQNRSPQNCSAVYCCSQCSSQCYCEGVMMMMMLPKIATCRAVSWVLVSVLVIVFCSEET